MNIFINARFLTQPVSGVQRYGIECSRKIKNLYPETVLLAPKDIWNKSVAEELGVTTIGDNKGHLWEQTDLPLYMKKKNNPPLFNPCNTAPLSYSNNFITLHDLAFYHHPEWNSRLFSMWYNFLIPRIVKKSRHLFTVSETVRDEIRRNYGVKEADISVTYNGISESMLSGINSGIVRKENIILAVGSFNVRKNHNSLIKAFMEGNIRKSHELVIVGDTNRVFRETGIDERELQRNNIRVLRQLSEDDLINMYRKAEILVSLSAYEGFGIPLLEGLFSGCKVVCSDIPVYRELYNDSAVFCNPFNIVSVEQAINTAIQGRQPDIDQIKQLLNRFNYETSARIILEAMVNA